MELGGVSTSSHSEYYRLLASLPSPPSYPLSSVRRMASEATTSAGKLQNVPVFDGKNFSLWATRFKAWCKANGVWGCVSGLVKRLEESGDEQSEWEQLNDKAFAALCCALPDNLLVKIQEFEGTLKRINRRVIEEPHRTCEAWAKLDALNVLKGGNTRLVLKGEWDSFKLKAGESVRDYWARAVTWKVKMAAAGGTVDEEDWILQIMKGLPLSWDPFIKSFGGRFLELGKEEILSR